MRARLFQMLALLFLSHRLLEQGLPFVAVDGWHRRDLNMPQRSVHHRRFHGRLVIGKFPDGHDVVLAKAVVRLDQLAAERLRGLLHHLGTFNALVFHRLETVLGEFNEANVRWHGAPPRWWGICGITR